MDIEKREFEVKKFSIDNEKDEMVLEGFALKWGEFSAPIPSGDDGYFYERFLKGAFEETIELNDQCVLYAHSYDKLLARTENKTAVIQETDEGLHIIIKLANTTLGRDVYELVKRGDITGLSIGFSRIDDEYTNLNGEVIRTITKAKLYEISLVTTPAYSSSVISKRTKENVDIEVGKLNNKKELRKRLILKTYL